MDIFIALFSIMFFAVCAWGLGRLTPIKICPICGGVATTWIWMLVAAASGYQVNLLVPAMLIGGSVVGIASQLEKKIQFHWPMIWKTGFIIFGFWVAYALVIRQWVFGFASLILLALFTYLFSLLPLKASHHAISELEKKMDDCC